MKTKEKLNIAHMHWGFPPIVGGVETHLAMILPEMVRLGHDVSLLTGNVEGVKSNYDYKGVHVRRTPLMDLNWLYTRGFRGLRKEILTMFEDFMYEFNPHVIHCHNMHYFSEVHIRTLQQLAKERGIPLILTAHNVWDDLLFLDLTLKIRWAHIIAVSHYIKRELIGAGCNDKKITVIHHGIDTEQFKANVNTRKLRVKYPKLKDRRIIFHPARIGLAKGCDVSLKALRVVRDRFPKVLLVMAGSKNIIDWGASQQKDIAYLVELIKIFRLDKNVLIDAFTLDEMAQIYALSEVNMYPSSVGEPFGLTMLESLSAGKPMIVTDAGGMPEIIQDGINGFVIPVKDFESLSSRIIQLMANDKLRQRFGYTGRQMVMSHYTKEIVTKNNIEVYKEVLRNRR
ncbi:MAG: glycosyltransferase family 4 protein [Candidatus Omnitrophica bacterium]|nr:glycosyltransferase family 4 protein [Candidatus Omnitrophota bacterium]